MSVLEFTVLGHPRPQGSMRVMPGSTEHRPRLAQSPHLITWRHELCLTMREALPDGWEPLEGPCEALVRFYLPRPRSQPKRHRPDYVRVGGDLDKYVRAVGDALTDAGVVVDDRVIAVWHAAKLYVGAGPEPLEVPGAVVSVAVLASGAEPALQAVLELGTP